MPWQTPAAGSSSLVASFGPQSMPAANFTVQEYTFPPNSNFKLFFNVKGASVFGDALKISLNWFINGVNIEADTFYIFGGNTINHQVVIKGACSSSDVQIVTSQAGTWGNNGGHALFSYELFQFVGGTALPSIIGKSLYGNGGITNQPPDYPQPAGTIATENVSTAANIYQVSSTALGSNFQASRIMPFYSGPVAYVGSTSSATSDALFQANSQAQNGFITFGATPVSVVRVAGSTGTINGVGTLPRIQNVIVLTNKNAAAQNLSATLTLIDWIGIGVAAS